MRICSRTSRCPPKRSFSLPSKPLAPRAPLILAAGFLVLFMGGGARFVVGLTFKPIVDDLNWDRGQLGLAVAMFQFVSAGMMFVAGRLTDRAGPRLVLGGGLAASAIGIGAMSAMTAPWHALLLYGVVFALGNGAASIIPVGVMVTRAFPRRMGIANATVMSGMSVGQLVMIGTLTAVMVSLSWRAVYLLLGVACLVLLPFLLLAIPKAAVGESHATPPQLGAGLAEAVRARQFWLLLAIYAICGFSDFFVSTHVVAFAQDRGVNALIAGNLLALMGLTGLIGVIAGGALSDRAGPVWPTALAFAARVGVFALVLVNQSEVSVALFALVFGATFLVTAPLTVVFVSERFGTRHLGVLTGLITMVHQTCGGIGAYLGAVVFDATGNYNDAFAGILALSLIALLLTLLLRKPRDAEAVV
jgi:predicted MFS family arabinose efflux permease